MAAQIREEEGDQGEGEGQNRVEGEDLVEGVGADHQNRAEGEDPEEEVGAGHRPFRVEGEGQVAREVGDHQRPRAARRRPCSR